MVDFARPFSHQGCGHREAWLRGLPTAQGPLLSVQATPTSSNHGRTATPKGGLPCLGRFLVCWSRSQ